LLATRHEVALIDTDPQASLARWHQRREIRRGGEGTGLGFAATTGWRTRGEIERRARDYDILLVDTPGERRKRCSDGDEMREPRAGSGAAFAS
jgi:chromosome partitioning protein